MLQGRPPDESIAADTLEDTLSPPRKPVAASHYAARLAHLTQSARRPLIPTDDHTPGSGGGEMCYPLLTVPRVTSSRSRALVSNFVFLFPAARLFFFFRAPLPLFLTCPPVLFRC